MAASDPDHDGILAVGGVVFRFGFLDLNRNQLVQILLGRSEQLARLARQKHARFIIFAFSKQRERWLDGVIDINLAHRSEGCRRHPSPPA